MSNKIGFLGATALVVGNLVGSGVLLMPADLAKYDTQSALFGLIITALGAVCLAITFLDLNKIIPNAGGPYVYSNKVFGKLTGFQMASGYWIFSWASNAALCIAATRYMSLFYPILGENKIYGLCFELACINIITFINMRSLETINFIQIVSTIFKLFPLLFFTLIGFLGIFNITFTPTLNENIAAQSNNINAVASIVLWAFVGIESAVVPSDKIENKKTIRNSTMVGILISTAIYLFGTKAVWDIVPYETLMQSSLPYVEATRILIGDFAANIVCIIGILGIIFTLNGWVLIQGLVPKSMADDKLLPAFMGKTNKHNAPYIALIVGDILISMLLITQHKKPFQDQFLWTILLSTFTIVIPYLYSSFSAFFLSIQQQTLTFSKAIVYAIGAIYSIYAIIGMPNDVLAVGAIAMFCLSVPFYPIDKTIN